MTHLTLAARSRQGTGRLADRLFRGSSRFAAIMLVVLLIAIGALLFANSRLTWETFGLSFITGMDWDPVAGIYGAMPFIVGTILASLLAIIIAAPIGIMTSLYLSELAPRRTATPLTFMIELLAAIPSVVWGFIGLTVMSKLTVTLTGAPVGVNLLNGGLILGLMSVPIIVSIGEDALKAVPDSYREASLAMGATRWQTVYRVLIPAARNGLLAAALLGVGRAVGETIAVLMATGHAVQVPHSLLDSVRTLTANIAAELGEAPAGSDHYRVLFLTGTLLFVITFVVNFSADLAIRGVRKR